MAKTSLAQTAYDSILDDIVTQTLQAGSLIAENELGKQLGMSRTPIREAFKRLAQEGFIKILPQKGAVVCGYSLLDMIKCHEIAKEVDGALAESISNSVASGEISKEALIPLYELVSSMNEAYEANDYKRWVGCDNLFHTELIALCTNQYIVISAQQLRGHLMRLSWFITPRNINLKLSNLEHTELLDHICRADAKGARSIARRQSERSLEELRSVYSTQ